MGDLTEHFSTDEFRCRHCGAVKTSCVMLEALEELRRIIGDRPIVIVSGYRCPRHNKAVGGATRSRHVYGDAVDLPSRLATPEQARRAGFTGIGTRGPWAVHVDTRPSPATWEY